MTVPIIQASSISKRFGSHTVLDQLDWRVEPGQVIGLLGRNGAGKSTLLECLLGLRDTDAGTVTVYGENAASLSEAARAKIGYVPQRSDLFEWLTPVQLLAYFKTLYPCWNGPRVDGLLGRWGFDAQMCNMPIGMLSGGEKQRLSIIRALAHDPELLVLDEPVSALDPVGRREFLCELIAGVIDCGTTVVFSTHILSDLERVAIDIAFLKDGQIALHGEMDALLDGARRVSAPAAVLAGLTLEGELRRTEEPGGRTSVVTRVAGPDAVALAARESEVRVDALSLEDLFIEVTR